MMENNLELSLKKIDSIFDTSFLLQEKVTPGLVEKYYAQSSLGYRFLHSKSGSVHMALNFDGSFSEEGYYGQAKIVEEIIRKTNAKKILELGSGKGFNSIYLAKRNQKVTFLGIDLTTKHLNEAKKKGREVKNIKFREATLRS